MRSEIGIIGGGKMGTAIARGLQSQNMIKGVWLGVRQAGSIKQKNFSIPVLDKYTAQVLSTRILILAVRPDQITPLVRSLANEGLLTPEHVLVSVAAGVTIGDIEACIKPMKCSIVRVMPNTLVREGHGLSVISAGQHAAPEHIEAITAIFETLGAVVPIEDQLMDAATALAASMPAFIYAMIDAIVMSGVGMGLSSKDATLMTTSVLAGTASIVQKTGEHPMALMRSITTPGGCTIAGLHELEAAGMRHAFNTALKTTARKASNLG